MTEQVVIYTDGACKGNPGPGGWGVLMQYKSNEKQFYGGEQETTNNRMELTAAIKGLEALIAQLEAGKSMASQITSSIDGTLEHTRSHFLCEEDSMKRFHYLPRGSHKAEHEEFLTEMNAALDQWKTSQNLSALKLYFLVQVPAWFMQHLNSTDLVTSRFLAQQRHFTYK